MTNVKRGEVWQADLNPTQGSEQAGSRPVLIFQNDTLNNLMSTVVAIPFTSNLKRAPLPTCVKIGKGEGGLATDSVLLCNQLRVLDKRRLRYKLGDIRADILYDVESSVLYTLGIN
jgi:mRNA interferase MazF